MHSPKSLSLTAVFSLVLALLVSAASPAEAGPKCTIKGSKKANRIVGTPGNDVICGLGGNDVIDGAGGNDVIYGGDGSDTVIGGEGDDDLYGELGNDTIQGNAGSDDMFGADGNDSLDGGEDPDSYDPGSGINTCSIAGDDLSASTVCSDLLPPTIDTASLRFSKTVVDNRKSAKKRQFKIQVRVLDDRSGVRNLIANLVAPNGQATYAVGGRAKLVSGSLLNGVWETTGEMPKSAQIGLWQVRSISAQDMTERMGTYTKQSGSWMYQDSSGGENSISEPGFASIRVVGKGDDGIAPKIEMNSFNLVTPTIDSSNPSILRLRLAVSDDVNMGIVNVLFLGPNGQEVWANGGCNNKDMCKKHLRSGNKASGTIELMADFPLNAPAGEWKIVTINQYDGNGSATGTRWDRSRYSCLGAGVWSAYNGYTNTCEAASLPEFPTLNVVSANPDVTSPSIDMSSISIGTPSVTNAKKRKIPLSIHVSDDVSGVTQVGVAFKSPDGRIQYSANQQVLKKNKHLASGSSQNGIWKMTLELPKYAQAGNWTIVSVNAQDKSGKFVTYYKDVGMGQWYYNPTAHIPSSNPGERIDAPNFPALQVRNP